MAHASSVVLLLLSVCAASHAQLAVGHTSVAWSDPNQGGKSVTAEIYYPALTAGDDVPVAAAPPSGFPVLAFGHGFVMPADAYSFLWEALVPAGYVMVLPTTGGELFPDHGAFAADLVFLIGRLESEGETPGSLFDGAIGTRSCVMGHSMGGGASVLAAAQDPTIDAVANLAAAETSPSAVAAAPDITQPALLLAGSDDCVTPIADHQQPIHAALGSECAWLVTLQGASHCQFSDGGTACEFGELFCSTGIGAAQQHALTVALLRDWLDAILYRDGSAWASLADRLDDPGLGVVGACDLQPDVFAVAGVYNASAGSVVVSGAHLDFVQSAEIDGAAAVISHQAEASLELLVGPAAPGFADLTLQTAFSGTSWPAVVPRHPAFAAGEAAVGEVLELRLDNGDDGAALLLLATAPAPPTTIGAIDGALELALPLATVVTVPLPGPAPLVLPVTVPDDASLVGVGVHVQVFATQDGAGTKSFSNPVEIVVGP